MEFSCARVIADWDAFASEWDQLFSRSHMQVPFLRFGYLRAWWQTLGGAEWQPESSALRIITAPSKASWLVSRLCFSAKNRAGSLPYA